MNGIRLLVPLLALGLPLMLAGNAPGQKPAEPKSPDLATIPKWAKADPKDDELRKLMKERYSEAAEFVRRMEPRVGMIPGEDFLAQTSEYLAGLKRLLDASMELVDKPEEKIEILKTQVELAAAYEKKIKVGTEFSLASPIFLHRARYCLSDAKIQLLKAKTEIEKSKPK